MILGRRDVDVAVLETARGGIVLRGVGYESNDASVLTNVVVRPPRPAGHPHPARAGRGQVDDLPDHASPTAGSCSTPTTRSSPRSPAASARRWRCSPCSARSRAAVRAPSGAGRPGLPRPARRHRRGQRRERDRDRRRRPTCRSRSAGWRATTSPTRWPPPAGRAGMGATIEQVRDGLADFAPSAERSPGRLNLFRLGRAGGHRRLRPQRGRRRGGPRRGRGDRRRGGRPGGADHRDHRHGRRPARRHAARASAGSPPSAPSGSRSRRRSSTCAAGPPSRSSASCWPAWWPAAGSRPRCRSTTPRPTRCGPS